LDLTVLLQPTTPAAFARLIQNKDFQSEKLTAYEVGYRVRPVSRLFVTFSGFVNDYGDLATSEIHAPFLEAEPPPPHIVLPLIWGNGMGGHAHGMELNADWRLNRWWRLNGGYSYLRINLNKKPSSLDITTEQSVEGGSPRHQVLIQSSLNLPKRVDIDWNFRFVSELPSPSVPSYSA
jgi:iron complex outermembrane receptor protein